MIREQRVLFALFAVLAMGFIYFYVAPSCPKAVSTQQEAKAFFHSEIGVDPDLPLVAVDRGTYWEVYQPHKRSVAIGQPEAQIDKCGGRATITSYYR